MLRVFASALVVGFVFATTPCVNHHSFGAQETCGWRGNWTGIYPHVEPPTVWGRVAKGVVAGITYQAARPPKDGTASGKPVVDGLIRDWLVIGPYPVTDSARDFAQEQIPGEADGSPAESETVLGLAWRRLGLLKKPDYENWGTAELDWVDLGETLGYKPNQVAYAHTYLHAARAGKVAFVVEHGHGLRLWLNGKLVYDQPKHAMALGSYVAISRQKQALVKQPSPRVELDLTAGWNRLLVKVGSYNLSGSRTMKFAHRLIDAEPVAAEQQNIVWSTPLPERTNASPVLVGERILTVAEPDELICLDKGTGRVLWRRINGLYEATPESERAGHPGFQQLAPLAQELLTTLDEDRALELRRQIRDGLEDLDKQGYKLKWDGHLEGHFAIVGFTTTPVSDGRRVFAFFGQGVAACYDLDGNRQWIKRLEADEVRYSCSPALLGGRLIVQFSGVHALDADTGQVVWSQPDVKSIAALIPARIAGVDVVATRNGEILRVSDGKVLWRNPHIREGDTGWAAPLIWEQVMYLPWVGVSGLIVADFRGVSGAAWQPQVRMTELATDHRRPTGEWLDRWTPSSPVVRDGVYYNVDQYGVLYAADLQTGATLYKQDLGFDELHHYNAIGVGASVALAGKYLFALDNQGCCAVVEAGREFRLAALNRIEMPLPRIWPIPPQEILANGAPVFDGRRMYLRGEKYLYCVGQQE